MSTVVAQQYNTVGNGARKLVYLPNGVLVTVLKDSAVARIYQSVNNGFSWEPITYIGTGNTSMETAVIPLDENHVGIAITHQGGITFYKVNIVTLTITTTLIETDQNEIKGISLIKDATTNEIHAAWTSRHPSYANAFNLRYTKGVIAVNGDVSWATPEQITKRNIQGQNVQGPCVVLVNGEVHIFAQTFGYFFDGQAGWNVGNGANAIVQFSKRATFVHGDVLNDWRYRNISPRTYNQGTPSAVVDSKGIMHITWDTNPPTHTYYQINYAKSGNEGANWEEQLLTNGSNNQRFPSISVDKTNTVYVVFGSVTDVYRLAQLRNYIGTWEPLQVLDGSTGQWSYPSVLFDSSMEGRFEGFPPTVYQTSSGVKFIGSYTTNVAPTLTVTSPTVNQTLHENSALTLAGNTTDVDASDVVTIKYQIDSGSVRNLQSAVSDGSTPIDFTKSLTYKDGVLKDGATVITSTLDKDMPHTVSMWAEDGNGGKSSIITRTFFVVPNRPPTLTINPITAQSELINSNVINVTGNVVDLDNNNVTLTFAINGGEEQTIIADGPASTFAFNILLNDLRVGANTVVLKVVDSYQSQTTKTLTITKAHNATPVNEAIALYKINAPTGSARSILLWISRSLGTLGITAEISLTDAYEPENFVPLALTNSAVSNGLRQDEYAYQGTADKSNIVLKITYDRTDAAAVEVIKQVSGVLF